MVLFYRDKRCAWEWAIDRIATVPCERLEKGTVFTAVWLWDMRDITKVILGRGYSLSLDFNG